MTAYGQEPGLSWFKHIASGPPGGGGSDDRETALSLSTQGGSYTGDRTPRDSDCTDPIRGQGREGGKSLFVLFMFCSPDGVTIVGLPSVLLRGSLHEQCTKSGIEAPVWKSGGSAVTGTHLSCL